MARNSAKKTQAASIKITPATRKKKSQSAISSLKTNGHVARGMAFLKAVVKERQENGEEMMCGLGIPTDELEKAFDKPPNRYSVMALEMFLVQKCFTDGLGESTATGIHGGFAAGFLNRDNDRYAGEYSYDEKQGEVRGCRRVLPPLGIMPRRASAHCDHGRVKAPSRAWAYASIYGICVHKHYLNKPLAGVSSFSACKLGISKMDVLGQLRIAYHTSKSILKTARAGRKKRGMMAREQVRLMAFTLLVAAEQRADDNKGNIFHVGRLYSKPG